MDVCGDMVKVSGELIRDTEKQIKRDIHIDPHMSQ